MRKARWLLLRVVGADMQFPVPGPAPQKNGRSAAQRVHDL